MSTRRSGSLSGNNNGKRSSSSDDKPPSPKRPKVLLSLTVPPVELPSPSHAESLLFLVKAGCRFPGSDWEFLPPSLFSFQEDNGAASDRPMPAAENSKELCSQLAPEDATVTGDQVASAAKGELTPSVSMAPPVAEGT